MSDENPMGDIKTMLKLQSVIAEIRLSLEHDEDVNECLLRLLQLERSLSPGSEVYSSRPDNYFSTTFH